MRVAFSDAYPEVFYGAQRMLLALLRALPSDIVPVLIAHGDGPLADEAGRAGIEVRAALPPPALRGRVLGRSVLGISPAIVRYGLALRPLVRDCAVVVANQVRAVLLLAPATLALRLPLVWYLRRPFRSGIADVVALAASAAIISVSDGAREVFRGRLRAWGDRKASTIPDGVDLTQWSPLDRGISRAALGLPLGAPVIACVATVTPNKGQDLLLDAAARLRQRFPDLEVLLCGGPASPGDRAYLDALRQRASGVRFLGYRADVRAIVAAADVVVLPSREEGFPGVLLEAMSMRRPVVATATAGARAIVEGGALVPVGDASALADALGAYLADRPLASRAGDAGRARVEAEFTIARTAERVADVLRRVAHQSSSE